VKDRAVVQFIPFICPNCKKVLLHTLPTAEVRCGACGVWIKQNKPEGKAKKRQVVIDGRKS